MHELTKSLPNPVPPAAASSLEQSLEGVFDRMGRTIAESPRPARRGSSPRYRRSLVAGFTAVAFALALISSLLISERSDESSAWAAEDIAMASETPQMLMPSTWKVTRLDSYYDGNRSGEMEFKNKINGRVAGLFWVLPKFHAGYVRDRSAYEHSATARTSGGHTAKIFYEFSQPAGTPGGTAYVALWIENNRSMRFETGFRGRPTATQLRQFKSLLKSVHPVTPEAWLSALPARYLLPSEIPQASERILADVPIPAGFNAAETLQNVESATERQLSLKLIGGVQCIWIGKWLSARRHGDRAEMTKIRTKLEGYRSWKHIPSWRIPEQGTRSYMGDMYIDSLKHGGAMDIGIPGKTRDVSKDYKGGLGCEWP